MNGMITILKRGLPLLAVVLLLGSCYWSSEEDSGGITTEVQSESTSGSGDNTVSGGDGDIARAYLLSGGGMQKRVYQLSGQKQAYQQSKFSGGKASFTFEGVPAGQTYEVLIAVGTLAGDNDGALDVHSYYRASGIEVTANATTDVDAERTVVQQLDDADNLENGFMTYALLGESVTGVGWTNAFPDDVFVSTGSTLYQLTSGSDVWETDASTDSPDGTTINSLSDRVSPTNGLGVLANTSGGVWELDSSGSPFGWSKFSEGLSGDPSVLRSAEFGNASNGYAFLFQQQGGIGFASYNAGTAGEIASELANEQTWMTVDLSEYEIVGEPVLDFSVDLWDANRKVGYAATKLGAFSATATSVDNNLDDGTWSEVEAAVNFLDDTVPDPVLSVGMAGDTLYLGTKNGAYRFPLKADGTPDASGRELVAKTTGHRIQDIIVSGTGRVALISPLSVVIAQPDGDSWTVDSIPFVALPNRVGERVSATWTGGSSELLVLAGTQGVGVLYPGNL